MKGTLRGFSSGHETLAIFHEGKFGHGSTNQRTAGVDDAFNLKLNLFKFIQRVDQSNNLKPATFRTETIQQFYNFKKKIQFKY